MIRISIHGVPRSGTTWLASIFDSSENLAHRNQPLFSYAYKGYLNESSSFGDILEFYQKIYETNDEFILQKKQKENGQIPNFLKKNITHISYKEARYHNILENLLEKDKDLKFIGIIRNPLSVLSSWYLAPKEFNKEDWNFDEEWEFAQSKNNNQSHEFYGYKKWKEVALLFHKLKDRYPERVYLVDYNKLNNDTLSVIRSVFSFCDIKVDNQTIDYIERSKNIDDEKNAYSVFRKKQTDDKWKNVLPSSIVKKIKNDLGGSFLEKYLYED